LRYHTNQLAMARVEKTVFISYRHTNSAWARAIFQDLTQHSFDVFLDFTGLSSGDFETVILDNIRSRAHFVVLLTPSALEECEDPTDWLRREIEVALYSKRNVVPLMLEGFDFGTPKIASQLTGKLGALKQYNAMSVPPEYFDAAMAKLRDKFLNVPLDAVLHPASPAARQAATLQKTAAARAPRVEQEELTAQQCFERGVNAADLAEKVRLFTEAIDLQPDFADAFTNRGLARAERGDLDGALEDYNQSIALKSNSYVAFNNRGNALADLGDSDGALADYDQAIELNPDYAPAYYNRGTLRRQTGDLDGSFADLDDAIRLRPNSADIFTSRGLTRGKLGDSDGALQDYSTALSLDPELVEAYTNRGIARAREGDLDGALADLNQAIRLHPDDAKNFFNRGVAHEGADNLEGALADYNEALRLNPDLGAARSSRDEISKSIAKRSKS
jgi:tetratricopeptide (TPR) repeat protein